MNVNGKSIISALIALSLCGAGPGFAQGNSDHGDRGRGEQRREHDGRQDGRRDDWRAESPRPRFDERREERGAGPGHRFHRGERLSAEYRHRHYVVDDWRGHQLSAPPRGYHWVQMGGDYVLVAIATGIIVQLMLNN